MGGLANSCLRMISTLNSHIDGLTELLANLTSEDRASAASLQASLVKSLTSLAEILDLMSRISPEPLATDYRRQCITALMRTIEIIHGLKQDFAIVGTFLGVRFLSLGQSIIPGPPRIDSGFRSRSSDYRFYWIPRSIGYTQCPSRVLTLSRSILVRQF